MPLVANLTDDNGDGAIDLCDTPDVVIQAFVNYGQWNGSLYVLDGATGSQHWKAGVVVDTTITPALGDIDADGVPEIVAFMQSSPVVGLAVAGDNAVDRVRTLLGPTDSKKADKGTIRGDFGVDVMVNVAHASDSPENAEIELKRFFKDEELYDYAMSFTTKP